MGEEEKYNVVFILMQCVGDRQLWSGVLRSFVYKLAEDGGPHIRCNTLVILHRFAEDADLLAIEVMEKALADPDMDVRHNAAIFLKALGHGQPENPNRSK